MLKSVFCFVKVGIALLISVIILSGVTIIYSNTGVHITNKSHATDYKWKPYQFKSNMKEGFSWLRMNGDGFNNCFDNNDVEKIDILLMGSSHMEAVNVPKESNVGYLLNNHDVPEYITYNIGISGHQIYQCVNNLADAVKFYNPYRYIIIETDSIELDEAKMTEVINNTFPIITSHDSGLLFYIQKCIPCFLPLYREIDNWLAIKPYHNQEMIVDDQGNNTSNSDERKATLDKFLDQAVASAYDRQIIIVYHPATVIDDKGMLEPEDIETVDLFRSACFRHSIEFVDMYEDFNREYCDNHVLPHGFTNTAVGEGHLNEAGHRLIAERLGLVIKELDNEPE